MPRLGLLLSLALAACSRSSAPAPAPEPEPASAPAPASASASASASAPEPAPTLSLACRSLATRTAEAEALYGANVRLATVDGTFLFIDPDHTPLFADSLRLAPRVLSALRHDRIAPRPLCPVSVYLFSSVDRFNDHCARRHYLPETGRNYGVYDRTRGEIVTDLSRGPKYVPTTAHELAHVLMDADWEAPLWFRECVASLYESPSLRDDDPGVIHGTDDWRYETLRPAVRAHDPEAHLGALFGMSDPDFLGKSDAGGADVARFMLHRATARATCQWLDAQDELWPLYQGWRGDRAMDPDGVATFTRVTGHAPTDKGADEDWQAWVRRTR